MREQGVRATVRKEESGDSEEERDGEEEDQRLSEMILALRERRVFSRSRRSRSGKQQDQEKVHHASRPYGMGGAWGTATFQLKM